MGNLMCTCIVWLRYTCIFSHQTLLNGLCCYSDSSLGLTIDNNIVPFLLPMVCACGIS